MDWIYLILAGLFEIGWPIGLRLGWSSAHIRWWPLAGAAVWMLGSSVMLFLAQRTIPLGTAYPVWTGLGVAGAFIFGLLVFNESATVFRAVCVALIGVGVIGLKLAPK